MYLNLDLIPATGLLPFRSSLASNFLLRFDFPKNIFFMSRFGFFSRHGKTLATSSAFGNTGKDKAKFFASALVLSSAGGLVISNIILTEERIESLSRTVAKAFESLGVKFPLNQAQAFSTADHGLHSPHYPWEFEKFYKTFDHAAYILSLIQDTKRLPSLSRNLFCVPLYGLYPLEKSCRSFSYRS